MPGFFLFFFVFFVLFFVSVMEMVTKNIRAIRKQAGLPGYGPEVEGP